MSLEHIFPGDSEQARRMRAFDWAETDLGSPEQWPTNLRVALGICLTSRIPVHVWWGPSLALFYNDAYIPFLGPKHPAVLGRSGREAMASIWHQIGPMIERVFATGEASGCDGIQMLPPRAAAKEEVCMTVSVSPVYGADKVDGVFCACTETTARARADSSICVPQAQARILLAEDDADMRAQLSELLRTEWSVTAVANGGQALASALAAPPDLVLTDVKMPWLDGFELLRRLREHPQTKHVPVILLSAWAGEDARVDGLQAGADDYLGKPFSERELVARVRTNLELARARTAAAHAAARSQAKDELLALLGHELRNPLAPIMTTLQVVAMTGRIERDQIAMMQRQVTHLTRLIHDLMDMSRIVLGNVELRLEPTDLAQVITQGVDLMAHLFHDDHQLELQLRRGIFVRADAARLAQVVASVLHNAHKFSPHASRIVITSERIGDRARLEIVDQGEGIAPEIIDRLFEPFFQVQQDLARSRGGLGVGLALARGIVDLHSGTITARSLGIGHGSAFTIELPVDKSLDVKTRANPDPAESPRVLVVDDNVETAAALSLGLQLFGYRVETAHSGDEALRVAEAFAPEIALLDIGLARGMDGYELGRRLREQRDVRLYAISGYCRPSDIERSRDEGFAEHLVKPLDLHVVARLLRASTQ